MGLSESTTGGCVEDATDASVSLNDIDVGTVSAEGLNEDVEVAAVDDEEEPHAVAASPMMTATQYEKRTRIVLRTPHGGLVAKPVNAVFVARTVVDGLGGRSTETPIATSGDLHYVQTTLEMGCDREAIGRRSAGKFGEGIFIVIESVQLDCPAAAAVGRVPLDEVIAGAQLKAV